MDNANLKPKILLVDDYATNLDLLEAYLASFVPDAVLVRAETGVEAMQAFWNHRFDLVLMDVMMPDISGFDLCQMMKEMRGEDFLPVIMITALNDKDSLLRGLSSGADDFLSKPVNREELAIRCRNLLRLRQTTVDLQSRYDQISQEMELARSMLLNLLPQDLPDFPGLHMSILYEPARIIGGDFYDILPLGEDALGIMIADVKGHGAVSAMMIATLKEQVLHAADLQRDPQAFLSAINANLHALFNGRVDDFFITAFYMVYHQKEGLLTWVNAGHNPPVYFSRQEAKVLDEPRGVPLGILKNPSYELGSLKVAPYGGMFLYTDGIFELPLFYHEARAFDNIEDLLLMLERSHVNATPTLLMREIRRRVAQAELTDDVNAIGLIFERSAHDA